MGGPRFCSAGGGEPDTYLLWGSLKKSLSLGNLTSPDPDSQTELSPRISIPVKLSKATSDSIAMSDLPWKSRRVAPRRRYLA